MPQHGHEHLHHLLHSEMNKIYLFSALFYFVNSLIGVFVPVFLYSKGFPMKAVLLFSLGESIIYLALVPIVIYLLRKIGFRKSLMISIPFYIGYLVTLQFVTSNPLFFHLAWILAGIYVSLFWFVYRAEIIIRGSKKKRSSQLGNIQIITAVASTVAPLIGGILLERTSYFIVLIVSIILLAVSFIPLWHTKDTKLIDYKFHYKDYKRLLKKKSNKGTKKSHMAEGIEVVLSATMWPIVLFIFLNERFAILGLLLTLLAIITIGIIGYLKAYLDKHKKHKILELTVKGLSLGWLGRIITIAIGSVLFYFFELFARLVKEVTYLSFLSIFYNNATKKTYIDALITRVIYLHGMKLVFVPAVILLLFIFGETLPVFLGIIAVGILSATQLAAIKEHEHY